MSGIANRDGMDTIRAKDIVELLIERFGSDPRKYIWAKEVAISTGTEGHRRIDFCVMSCYASSSFAIEGIEVKVDPADLRHEIREFEKHEAFFPVFDYYSVAITQGVYDKCKDIIPKDWGIYIAKTDAQEGKLSLRCKRKPFPLPDRSDGISRGFVASFTRKAISDATAHYKKDGSDKFNEGYQAGYNTGCHNTEIRIGREMKSLEHLKELSGKFQRRGGVDIVALERNLKIAELLDAADVDEMYRALRRLHGRMKAALAEFSGILDDGDGDGDGAGGGAGGAGMGDDGEEGRVSPVSDEDVEAVFDAYEKGMDEVRKSSEGIWF